MKKKRLKTGSPYTYLVKLFKVLTVMQCLSHRAVIFAIENTTLISGTKNLANDATTVALAIESAVIALLEIKTGIAYQQAEPEEKTKHKKEAKGILMVGVLIVCATSLIKVVLGYYGA